MRLIKAAPMTQNTTGTSCESRWKHKARILWQNHQTLLGHFLWESELTPVYKDMMTAGSEGALGQILFTWQVLPVLLGFGDSQVLALALGHSSRKDDPDSLIRLRKTPKREKILPRHTQREWWGC